MAFTVRKTPVSHGKRPCRAGTPYDERTVSSLRWSLPLATLIAALYGLFMGALFSSRFQIFNGTGASSAVMGAAFLIGMPVALGFLSVYVYESAGHRSWLIRALGPWLAALVSVIIALAIGWEGMICIVMWLPLFLSLASVGGLAAGLLRDYNEANKRHMTLVFCLILPLLLAPVEQRFPAAARVRVVETEIQIDAPRQVVWRNIKSVDAIQPEEQTYTWTQRIGFPRPIAATLSAEGVGGVRRATFAGGVVFHETVTEWQPPVHLAFTIRADTAAIPATTLDRHVTIGGAYFDVLDGDYRIVELGPRRVLLRLVSRHRLSTRLNPYAALWTGAILRDIQNNILGVIKRRSERS